MSVANEWKGCGRLSKDTAEYFSEFGTKDDNGMKNERKILSETSLD